MTTVLFNNRGHNQVHDQVHGSKFSDFGNWSNFEKIGIFLHVLAISIQGCKKRLNLSRFSDFILPDAMQSSFSRYTPDFSTQSTLGCTTGLAGWEKSMGT